MSRGGAVLFVNSTLQNEEKYKLFSKTFGYITKKLYLCSTKLKKERRNIMENVRVMYIDPDTAEKIDGYVPELLDEDFKKLAVTYDLPTFAAKFNYDEISDLGYIRFINV